MTDKTSFILYTDYKEDFELLSAEQCKTLILALFEFHETGNKREFDDGMVKIAYQHMTRQLKRDMEKWESTCKKRSEAGRRGGLKSQSKIKANQANANFAQANQADTVNETDTVNDNVTDNESVTDNDNEARACSAARTHTPDNRSSRLKHGEFGHVLLTANEHKKLVNKFGRNLVNEYIRKIDEWVQLTGKTYLDYYLAVVNWIKQDNADSAHNNTDNFDIEKYKQFINCF